MQFMFNHHADAVLPFLQSTKQHLEAVIPAGHNTEMVLNKCKFILIELCTNGIKHSGHTHSIFEIFVENNRLFIQRKDYGLPFNPGNGRKELLSALNGVMGTVILTEDDMNRLFMQQIDDHTVRFYVEELPLTDTLKQQNMNEHFGLIIICRSSDYFTYSRMPDGLNIFAVRIQL